MGSGVDHLSALLPPGQQHSPFVFPPMCLFEHAVQEFSAETGLDNVINHQSDFSNRNVWPVGKV